MDKSLKNILESELNEEIISSIPKTGKIKTISGREYFLKSGQESQTYQCEANGLNELRKANTANIAKVISSGENYILTEYIEEGIKTPDFFQNFGKQFAKMHHYHSQHFGFYENNFIGNNLQLNIAEGSEKTDWTAFYFNKRLLYQYKLAEKSGYASQKLKSAFIKLESKIEQILNNTNESPTLLHGDLWSGNFLSDQNGEPVLIDPAVYYGHREADLAMTKLFGRFPTTFYKAYIEEYPLREGWEYREDIYKLYHILNHLNIFGEGYLPEAEYILEKYTSKNN